MYGAVVDLQNYPPPPSFGPPAPPPRPQWNGKTNGFSIAALTLSLFGCTGVLTIVFGFIGLSQSRRNGDKRGKVFAIVALCIVGLWLTALAVAIIVAVARDAADGPDRDRTGAIRGERSISLYDLRTGDCAKDLKEQKGDYIDVLPCSSPHTSELFATYDLTAAEAKAGETKAEKTAEAGCEKRFEAYAGKKNPAGSDLFLFTVRMSELKSSSDRGVLCFAHQLRGTVTGSVRD